MPFVVGAPFVGRPLVEGRVGVAFPKLIVSMIGSCGRLSSFGTKNRGRMGSKSTLFAKLRSSPSRDGNGVNDESMLHPLPLDTCGRRLIIK